MLETIFCPFCGSPAWDFVSYDSSLPYEESAKSYIYCLECRARGPEKDDSVQALDAWRKTSERIHEPVYKEGGKF